MVSEMECKDAKQKLSEDLDGRLSAEEIKALDAHIEGCESCRSEKADLSKINEALGDLAVPMVEIPDPEKTWKAINEKLGDEEPGDEDPYAEQILVDTSGEVDIRGLVGGALGDETIEDESDSGSPDIFGIATGGEGDDEVPMATLAPPPVLMPMSRKPSWMVPAAVVGGVFIAGVIALAAFLFVKEGRRQKVEEREDLARSLDSRFEKDETTISARDEKGDLPSRVESARPRFEEDLQEQMEEPRPGSEEDEERDPDTPFSEDLVAEIEPTAPRKPSPESQPLESSRRARQTASERPVTGRAPPATRTAKARPSHRDADKEKEPAPTAQEKPKKDDPLSALLGAGESPKPSKKESAAAASSLPERLSQNQIKRVMTKAESQINRCYQKYKEAGLLRVSVTVQGDTGIISSVSVHGDFKGSPTASCALRAVRPLTFPRFQGPTQSFVYPYLLR